jgi:hypothetical protein
LFSNNSQSVILGQLGANSSLHFSGPVRGVLPIRPNSLPGLDTLNRVKPSLLPDAKANAPILSYNYTLNHQGLASNISCIYDRESPIRFSAVPNNTHLVGANGSCNGIGLADIWMNTSIIIFPNTNKTLTIWACKSMQTVKQDPAYYIYLRGLLYYSTAIGNITCTVFPIQPALFPVKYQSSTGIFSTQERIAPTTFQPASLFSHFIEQAILGLAGVVSQSQSLVDNLVAESVIDLGVQSLSLFPYTPNNQYLPYNQYLPLWAAMIQGILVNQVCAAIAYSLS